ncbi:hypothetical protein AB0L65_29630 [Nonomuraea sp. NPDC052116]|uniref:hypothetical protein n=1 Tax=Nonomuraea sp. NPDC052116 TaxID=3155665 RepID=UPI003441354A
MSSGAPQYSFVRRRELGVTRALGERGIDGDDAQMLIHVEATEQDGHLAARQALTLRPRPDGVIIDNPRQVMASAGAAADLGVFPAAPPSPAATAPSPPLSATTSAPMRSS